MASIIYRPAGDTDFTRAVRVTVDENNLPQTISNLAAGNYEVFHEGIYNQPVAVTGSQGSGPGATAAALVIEPLINSTEWLMHGMYWLRPYDLSQMGSAGAAVMARVGKRYVWFWSSDHGGDDRYGDHDGAGIRMGFSDDPATPPETGTVVLDQQFNPSDRPEFDSTVEAATYLAIETPWLVYNPDDAEPFWVYVHGVGQGEGRQDQDTFVISSTDLRTFNYRQVTHKSPAFNNHHGYQSVVRHGPGDWSARGRGAPNGSNNLASVTRSADGLNWTYQEWQWGGSNQDGTLQTAIPLDGRTIRFGNRQASNAFEINGRRHNVVVLDSTGGDQIKEQALVVAPVEDITYEAAADAAGNLTYLREWRPKDFPSLPNYIQSAHGLAEDGILHLFVLRGYFQRLAQDWEDAGRGSDVPEVETSYYAYLYDESAAASAAPSGLRASCTNGVVTVRCNDILPQSTYRLERGTTQDGPWSLVADSGPVITDNAPVRNALNYYRMTTLQNGTARRSRVIPVYAGTATSTLGSRHLTRVALDGFDMSTIDVLWLETCITWLASEGLTDKIRRWVSPSFGIKRGAGDNVEQIGDLVSTIHTHWGEDARVFEDRFGTYTANGMDSGVPAVGGEATNMTYALAWGRHNLHRRTEHLGLTWGAFANFDGSESNPVKVLRFGQNDFNDTGLLRNADGSFAFAVDGAASEASIASASGDVVLMGGITPYHADAWVSVNAGTRTTVAGTDNGILYGINGGWGVGATLRNGRLATDLTRIGNAQGHFTFSDIFAFGTSLTPAQESAFASFLQTRGSTVEKSIQADYGAVGDGVTNDNSAFVAFRDEHGAETVPVTLNIEPGEYVTSGLDAGFFQKPFADLTVRGATPVGGVWPSKWESRVGGFGQYEDNLHSVRLEAVTAGDTEVTVKNEDVSGTGRPLADLVGLCGVGSVVYLASYDLMGYGFPTNHGQFSFHRITSADPVTGVLGIDPPARHNHPDDAPVYNSGNGFNVDQGGPATLYAMHPDFEGRVVNENLQWRDDTQTYMAKEHITLNNIRSPDLGPGSALSVSVNGGLFTGRIETDKLCDVLTINDADVSATFLAVQSSSIRHMILNRGVYGRIDGTAEESDLTDVVCNGRLMLGTPAFGATKRVAMTNCTLNGGDYTNHTSGLMTATTGDSIAGHEVVGGVIRVAKHTVSNRTGDPPQVGDTVTGLTSGATATVARVENSDFWLNVASISGMFIPGESLSFSGTNTAGQLGNSRAGREWAVPGALLLFQKDVGTPQNPRRTATAATVTKLARAADGVNEIHTDVASFPAYALPLSAARNHPCPDFSANGLIGTSDQLVSLNAHANNSPLGSVVKIWMGADGIVRGGGIAIGKIVSFEANVTKAYTGAHNSLYFLLHRNNALPGIHTLTGAAQGFHPVLDLRQPGYRIWSDAGNSGQVGNDNAGAHCDVFTEWAIDLGSVETGLFRSPDSNFNNPLDISGEAASVRPLFDITIRYNPTWRPS